MYICITYYIIIVTRCVIINIQAWPFEYIQFKLMSFIQSDD